MKKMIVSSIAIGALAMASVAFAQTGNAPAAAGRGNVLEQGKSTEARMTSSGTTTNKGDARASATSSEAREKKGEKSRGMTKSEEHRSEVAKFVQTLLDAATRIGGIGEEVRAIAHEQESSAEKTAAALSQVEERGKFKTFLIGADYKNLGVVRSEIVTTQNRLDRLSREVERMASSTDKTAITAEIESLTADQSSLEAFVKENEDVFSVFGWVVKIFQ